MTNLSRRRFFGLLGGTAATYFLPPIGGWKSDVIESPYVTGCDFAVAGGDITSVTIFNAGTGYYEPANAALTYEVLHAAYKKTIGHQPDVVYFRKPLTERLWTS